MGNDKNDELPDFKLPINDGGQQNRRRGRNRNRWNNPEGGAGNIANGNPSAKFPTRSKDLPEHVVFDNTGQVDAANFTRSLKGMANFLHTTYSAEVSEAILKMQMVVIDVDENPPQRVDGSGVAIPLSSWEEYKWKKTYTEQSNRLKTYNESLPKAYIYIYNQCSTNLKNDLESSSAFPAIEAGKDPIGLLKLIQGLCCSYDSKTQSVMATVASQKKLFTFYQKEGMDNSTYHREFIALIDTIETYGGTGAIGVTPTFVAQTLNQMQLAGTCANATSPTKEELSAAHKTVRDEFLAALMLSGANRERYGALRNELANQYGFGNDLYPKSVDQCLTMMNRRKDSNPRQARPNQQQQPQPAVKKEEEALVFAQHKSEGKPSKSDGNSPSKTRPSSTSTGSRSSSSRSHSSIKTVICRNCGKEGHVSAVCPTKRPPEQIHAIATAPDDASESSEDDSVLILAQTTSEALFTQDHTSSQPHRPISTDLLLLDSQSTVHLFSHPEHVNNIRPATRPIRVHCNKGTLDTTLEADFGDTPVYFDSRGIANVLSLYQLGQKFHVTYDSKDRGGVFKVHTTAGVVEFTPTAKGLHAINLRENPTAALVLVNEADLAFSNSPVLTVRSKFEGFTKKQIQGAATARRLMGMIGAPSEREYQGLVRMNLLPNCPITHNDIVNAHNIYGPDLANIRGKTTRRKPEHVHADIVDIPQQILNNQKYVTLTADVMFVNGVPFLVSSSKNINLTTIEHVPSRTADKLGFLLHRIMKVYARAGFTVRTILMDNEFEKVKDYVHQATLNTTAAAEHVGDIERRIRVVKERCRGIICTLPYTSMPRIMLIHLLHHVVLWLNNFPVANGVSSTFSPREIILRHKLDAKRHCRAPFGAYCEVHEENDPTNSMKSRGIPAICLGPTGNLQGTYSFLNLATGLVLKRRRFTELPAPDSIIKRVSALAGPHGISPSLVFMNRNKIPFDWPDDPITAGDGLDTTPIAPYPLFPAEMPGISLSRHLPSPQVTTPTATDDINWENIADEAAWNADLTETDLLPPPPPVITIDDEDDIKYAPAPYTSPLTDIKHEPIQPELPPAQVHAPTPPPRPRVSRIPIPTTSTRSGRTSRRPVRLNDYHLFTTVAEEQHLPHPGPYLTAGGSEVSLDILDEDRMAHLCQYVMVHTATSLALAQDGHPTKKQYGLKAGIKQFGPRADTAVTKELTQMHTMNCFRPRDPHQLTRQERRNALSSLMFLTEK